MEKSVLKKKNEKKSAKKKSVSGNGPRLRLKFRGPPRGKGGERGWGEGEAEGKGGRRRDSNPSLSKRYIKEY